MKVWDLLSGEELRSLGGDQHARGIWSIALNGRTALTASADMMLRVRDIDNGKEPRTIATNHAGSDSATSPLAPTVGHNLQGGHTRFRRGIRCLGKTRISCLVYIVDPSLSFFVVIEQCPPHLA